MKAFATGFAILLSGLIAGTSAHAFGRDDHWVSGFGQGVCESVVTSSAGNRIYVACDCGSGRPPSINFELIGRSPQGSRIFLTFDAQNAEDIWVENGRISANCRACAGNFDYVLDLFRRHNRVRVMAQNGDAATFTLKGASRALGQCKADFLKY